MKQQWRVSPWLNSIASLVFNLILHRSNLPHHLPMKQIPTNSCCIVKNHPCIYPIAIIRAIFFFENVSSNIRRGISSLGIKDKIESNSFPLDMEKTVRNFFPEQSHEQAVKICPLRCTRASYMPRYREHMALIFLFYCHGRHVGNEGESKGGGNAAFFTPCWKSTNIRPPRFHQSNSYVTDIRVSRYTV